MSNLRLATYGTLAPGRVNHHELAALDGVWTTGIIHGRLIAEGWGAAHGCPGIMLDPEGEAVEVHIFESADLPAHWPRLDAFEGPGYRRVTVAVATENGPLEARIYELAPDPKCISRSPRQRPGRVKAAQHRRRRLGLEAARPLRHARKRPLRPSQQPFNSLPKAKPKEGKEAHRSKAAIPFGQTGAAISDDQS